jgi:murein DD-endopeptidase MepM/ murein hydrolase activator NlpD
VTPQAAPPAPSPPAAPPLEEPAAGAETQVAVIPPSQLPDPAPRAAARFAWPLPGKVIATFGPAGGGLHNDGINIAAALGTQVRAADNGVVAYAGNELRGFGNLLLIKHADGWTTAYAHNDKLLVQRGDTVTQGQVIATVGRTGNVDAPQLHFEVRKGTQAMNPIEFLAAR